MRGSPPGNRVLPGIGLAYKIGELRFPYHTDVAVYLTLDLVRKHAAGLWQLTYHDEDLAAVDELAVLGTKRDLLAENELVCWHVRYRARPVLLPVLSGFLSPPGLPPLAPLIRAWPFRASRGLPLWRLR